MATMTDEEREARIAEIGLELRELVELMNEDADRMAFLLVDLKKADRRGQASDLG